MARKKTAIAQVGLRLREPLRAKVAKAAKARGVSMNQELVDRIEGSFLTKMMCLVMLACIALCALLPWEFNWSSGRLKSRGKQTLKPNKL